MREDLCKLRPSLGRFAGVIWAAPGDGTSDSITIHNWGLLELQHSKHSVLRFENAARSFVLTLFNFKAPNYMLARTLTERVV